MGMPVEIEIVDGTQSALDTVFDHFREVDERFSTYKESSEISRINRKELAEHEWSQPMREIFALAERTARETRGFFSIERPDGLLDPSGIVKGWAIRNAARLVDTMGYDSYFLNVGGDIQSRGLDERGAAWTVGIRNPFKTGEIVKVLRPHGAGVATSGNYLRGNHIYNPHAPHAAPQELASLTVVGPDVYEADRFATAAFAMGTDGVYFVESLPGFEAYAIDANGTATMTSGFETFLA